MVKVDRNNACKIDIPLGTYNPDRAVSVKGDENKVYFVVETKGTEIFNELRPAEQDKIRCAFKWNFGLFNNCEFNDRVIFESNIEQAMTDYRRLGYSENWINQRIKSIEIRKELTDEWKRTD